ncbi:MAG: hypothetical protein ACLUIX_01760 [Oscillospiraceae bacterium]
MAMAWIWTGMAVVSVVCGAVYGRMEAVSAAALEGAGQAVRLCLSMAGMLCLWTGLMEVMDRCGCPRWDGCSVRSAASCAGPAGIRRRWRR